MNLDKTDALEFITKSQWQYLLNIGYNVKCVEEELKTSFLAL
jgi:hypothetical protein